jgi:hypothetical protein
MKGSTKRVVWPLALAIGLVMAAAATVGAPPSAAAPAAAQASDPVAVVDAFHAAGDDIEAALALLTDDVLIELSPPPPNSTGKWSGKAEVRAFFEWRNANNIRRLRAGDAQVVSGAAGTTVSGNVGVDSNLFTRLGLGTVGHTFRAEVQDGKLKYYLGQLAPEEQKRVSEALRLAAQPAGMPRTGEPVALPLIFALGVLLLLVGSRLRRRIA